jgi:hypothetical protein
MKNKKVWCSAILVLVFVAFSVSLSLIVQPSKAATQSVTRYVSSTGNDSGDCISSSTPCRTLQYAANRSVSGDRILVAGGTYNYNSSVNNPCPSWTNSIVCFINKNLTILGGFSNNNWSFSDPEANPTIIDGQNSHRGVVAVGYKTSNAYTLEMQDITIQNCLGTGAPAPFETSGIGGGMLVQHAAVILRDMTFKNNKAVGANTNSGDGGAADGAALRLESTPSGTTSLIQRVVFDSNQSLGGAGPDRGGIAFGALFVYDASAVVEDAIFTNNLAQAGNSTGVGVSNRDGLRADALGGGVSINSGQLTLRNVKVTDNKVRGGNAGKYGGGAFGAGIFAEGVNPVLSTITMSDVYVSNNTATAGNALTGGNATGGGIAVSDSLVTIERVEAIANSAIGGSSTGSGNAGIGAGGGIYLATSRTGIPQATINNIVIADNFASQGIGLTSPGNGSGGGIVFQGVTANMKHVTVARNRIEPPLILGQGIMLLVSPLSSGSVPSIVNIENSVISDHTYGDVKAAAVVVNQGNTLNFSRGMFSGNNDDTNADGVPVPAGSINGIGTMVSASSVGYVSPGAPNYNYHLRVDSAAKDQALQTMLNDDINGQNRPYQSSSDFGADEYWPIPFNVVPGDGNLRLDWSSGMDTLKGGVNSYSVLVDCTGGGNPPVQGDCGVPINTETATDLFLTGLSNFTEYRVTVFAYDSSQNLVASSDPVSAFPTDLAIYVPLVVK